MAVPIIVCLYGSHDMAIMLLQSCIIHWRKLEKTNYMEEDPTKPNLVSAKIPQKLI